MRIAVAHENGQIFQSFGETGQFKVYDAVGTQIVNTVIIPVGGGGQEAVAAFLGLVRADVLICGGIDGSIRAALTEGGMMVYPGVNGGADHAVQAFLGGALGAACGQACGGGHGCGSCGGCGGHGGEGQCRGSCGE